MKSQSARFAAAHQFAKAKRYQELGHAVRCHHQGVIVDEVVMVNKKANKWKFLGSPDWYRFRYSADLSNAIKTGTLKEFAILCARNTSVSKKWDKVQRDEFLQDKNPIWGKTFLDDLYYHEIEPK